MNKKLLFLIGALFAFILAGCAANPVNISTSEPAVTLHNDLLGAAAVATQSANAATDPNLKAALQARAAWWTQLDALVTARENQASACVNAIKASAPSVPNSAVPATKPHVFTDVEIAAEAVGTASGITPAMKLACEPLPIPTIPAIPKLP